MPSLDPGQHVGVFGVTGTGKTELVKQLLAQLVAQGRRVVVLDAKNELSTQGRPRENTQVGPLKYKWFASQVADRPSILLTPNLQLAVVPDEFSARKCARTFRLLATTLKAIGEEGRNLRTVFVCEEVQLWADDERKLLEEVGTVWRDYGVSLVLVSQRPAGIPIDARSQLQEIHSFAQTEPADIEALRLRCSLTDPTYHERVQRLTPESHQHQTWRAGQLKEIAHGEKHQGSHQQLRDDERSHEVGSGSSGDPVHPGEDSHRGRHQQLDLQGGRILQPAAEGQQVAPPTGPAPSDGVGPKPPPAAAPQKPTKPKSRRRRRAAPPPSKRT